MNTNTGYTTGTSATGTTGATGTTTTTTPHTVNDGSAGANAANSVGDKLKGGWGVFHGAGEGIRGNINSFVDNVGEQIAGRGQTDAKPAQQTEGGERPAHVAARGADEIEAGINRIQR